MPVYAKADSERNIINGGAVVLTGNGVDEHAPASRTEQFSSIDDLSITETLEERFLVPPSGWSA